MIIRPKLIKLSMSGSCPEPTQHYAGHWVNAQKLSETGNSVPLSLKLQRMERGLQGDERVDRHLECWAKGVRRRSYFFSKWPGSLGSAPHSLALMRVSAPKIYFARELWYSDESYSSPLKKTSVTQLQAFFRVVVTISWAVYTLWFYVPGWVHLGDSWPGAGSNLCCRNTPSVCEAGKRRDRKQSQDLVSTKPSCHGDYSSICVPGFLMVLSEGGK